MMTEVQAALHRLRGMDPSELDRLCRRHAVRVLTVFGSAIADPDDEPSDLDLGVIFEPGAPHGILGLLEALVSTLRTERIDVLDAERASETARVRAIADGVAVYESEPTAYAFAAMAADALFLETAPMRRAALESLGS